MVKCIYVNTSICKYLLQRYVVYMYTDKCPELNVSVTGLSFCSTAVELDELSPLVSRKLVHHFKPYFCERANLIPMQSGEWVLEHCWKRYAWPGLFVVYIGFQIWLFGVISWQICKHKWIIDISHGYPSAWISAYTPWLLSHQDFRRPLLRWWREICRNPGTFP